MPEIINQPKSQVILVDEPNPEVLAMEQALYSRDPRSILIHVEDVKQKGHEKFMAQFYVGYGHKSIGDCGSTTLCFENGSILLPKAVQDWRLYNGQEASTRYLDMTGQDLINPCKDEKDQATGKIILERWMALYVKIITDIVPFLQAKYPYEEGQIQSAYDKAIKVKAFDIARGFLPAAVTTYASWHTNLRQAYDHLHEMQHHPLEEIRKAANDALDVLKAKYPSSFSHKTYPATEEYLAGTSEQFNYFDLDTVPEFEAARDTLDTEILNSPEFAYALEQRPQKTELPKKMEKHGQVRFVFQLDFGSFRDLQRHRAGICEMPLLTTKHGFYPWYLGQLSPELRELAESEITELTKLVESLSCDKYTKQYYVAMGFTVACEFTGGLPALVYLAELRAAQTVHSTLRVIAQKMGAYLLTRLPKMALYCDNNPDEWNIKRGTQDIVKKPEQAA